MNIFKLGKQLTIGFTLFALLSACSSAGTSQAPVQHDKAAAVQPAATTGDAAAKEATPAPVTTITPVSVQVSAAATTVPTAAATAAAATATPTPTSVTPSAAKVTPDVAPPSPTPAATKPTSLPAKEEAASVQIVSVTSPAARNATATLKAKVAPGATASIVVHYKSGPSTAAGLETKQADINGNGNVSWSWKVGGNTSFGSWPITVRSGNASAETSFEVVR
ncbi:hypothetical protein [Paenibacillus whitsoniae]|uniref:Uncharacterized protein n=1 Tax=Paenibacillus whitsoniae TaxID=2496558 RepID=A0A3S0A3Q9_9BACL|nr:hypothetical protein [Paenibacillus whitsoniae]RTE08822.1 hypothetical protein EJQ19_14950 [Paenibacillus whitsoniae]